MGWRDTERGLPVQRLEISGQEICVASHVRRENSGTRTGVNIGVRRWGGVDGFWCGEVIYYRTT